jgi:hypothetical protein
MSSPTGLDKINVQDFSRRFRQEMIPLNNTFAYFSALPLGEEEVKEFLEEPVAALPPAVQAAFSKTFILLVPHLEKAAARGAELVSFGAPDERNQVWSSQFLSGTEAVLAFAIKNRPVADYHDSFYRAVATLLADRGESEALETYSDLVREELRGRVHGELDQEGWRLKEALLARQSSANRETKLFRSYARQSVIDTLTLYLHGICCDIDVETGPRQLPSRYLRKRLEYLEEVFPPPPGYAVFPEELDEP